MRKGFMLLPSIFLRTEAVERSRNLAEGSHLPPSCSFISVTLAFRFKPMNIIANDIRGTYRGSATTAHELWSLTVGCNSNNEKNSPSKVEELWWQPRENFLISSNKFRSSVRGRSSFVSLWNEYYIFYTDATSN